MSEELRPCPFCRKSPRREVNDIGREVVYCPGGYCPIAFERMSEEEWNHRPIEDALRADLARKDAEIAALDDLVWALKYESLACMDFVKILAKQDYFTDKAKKLFREMLDRTSTARAKLAEVRGEG